MTASITATIKLIKTLITAAYAALRSVLPAAVGAQHGLAEGVELFRLERAEDVAVGPFGGAKVGPELPRAGGHQGDAAAPAVVLANQLTAAGPADGNVVVNWRF